MQSSARPSYVFIIPLHNEEAVLEHAVAQLYEYLTTEWEKRDFPWIIVLASNGSTDGTEEIAVRMAREHPHHISFLSIPEKGRGYALKEAVRRHGKSAYYLYIDVDLPLPLQQLPNVLAPLERGEAELVATKRLSSERPILRRFMTFSLRVMNALFFDMRVGDSQCGVKAFNHHAAQLMLSCRESGFFLDTEVLVRAHHSGMKVAEVSISWIESRYDHRKSTVHFFRDSRLALRMLSNLFRELYPRAVSSLLSFCGIGICFVLFFTLQTLLSRWGGYVPLHQAGRGAVIVGLFSMGHVLLTIALWRVLTRMKRMPWNIVHVLIAAFFGLIAMILLFSNPTNSQDLYWNLLLTRGWTELGMNPYTTTPQMLSTASFFIPLQSWNSLPMTHGPAWVLFISLFTALRLPLGATLVLLKSTYLLLLIGAGWIFRRICLLRRMSEEAMTKMMAMLALSPFILQHTLIDVHSDIFILLSLLSSYYFLLRRQYALSIAALLFGAYFKYVTLLAIPIPLILSLRGRAWWQSVIFTALSCAFAVEGFFTLSLPFGWDGSVLRGFFVNLLIGTELHMLLGSALISGFSSYAVMRILGIAIAGISLLYYLSKQKIVHAYTIPYLLVFFFATPWFMPWYVLWVYPLVALLLPPAPFAVFTAFFLMTESLFLPLINSILWVVLGAFALVIFFFFRSAFPHMMKQASVGASSSLDRLLPISEKRRRIGVHAKR